MANNELIKEKLEIAKGLKALFIPDLIPIMDRFATIPVTTPIGTRIWILILGVTQAISKCIVSVIIYFALEISIKLWFGIDLWDRIEHGVLSLVKAWP